MKRVNKFKKSNRVSMVLGLMILVLGLFIFSEFLNRSFDNRSRATNNIEEFGN